MRLLVDAHTVIWAVDDPSKLSRQAVTALQDPGNDLLLSAGTIWEIAKLDWASCLCRWRTEIGWTKR